jgi:hypothetical protein
MSYPLFREDRQSTSFQNEALKSNTAGNQLTSVYFSKKNIDALQDAIRYQVYIRSGKQFVIDKQSETELKVVMRSIYLEYSRNMTFDIVGQVRELNGKVLEFCVDKILAEIRMYLHYRQDINTTLQPLDRSVSTTTAGSKTLFLKEF